MRQQPCEIAMGPGSPGVRALLCSGLLHFLHSALCHAGPCWFVPLCLLCQGGVLCLAFHLQPGKHKGQYSMERQSTLSKPEGSQLTQTKVPAPGPWLFWSHENKDFLCFQMRSLNSWSLLAQKALLGLVRMEPLWLVSKDVNEHIAAQFWLEGESLSTISWNRIPMTFL